MSKYGNRPGKLRLSGIGMPERTRLELDVVDIARIATNLSLKVGVDHLPVATVDVVLSELDTELENPLVRVPDETRDLLVRLGWTPPAEEASDAV